MKESETEIRIRTLVTDYSTDGHSIHTNYKLCREIIDEICTDRSKMLKYKKWLVLCTLEFVYIIMEKYHKEDLPYSEIIFASACKNKRQAAEKLDCKSINICYNNLKELTDMKFNVIVGNPPYQAPNNTKSTRTTRLYMKFVEMAVKLAPVVSLVTPSNWIDDVNHKIHKITGDKFVKVENCSDHFNIAIPTVYFIYLETSQVFKFDKNPEKNLGSLWYRTNINRNDKDICDDKAYPLFVEITGPKGKDIEYKNFRGDISKIRYLDKWKVITNNVGGYDDIGCIKIIEPNVITSFSVVCLITKSQLEAKNLQEYLNTKFVKNKVKKYKQQTPNSKKIFSRIPLVDLSRSWTDRELCEHFNLTQEEIDLIESTVK